MLPLTQFIKASNILSQVYPFDLFVSITSSPELGTHERRQATDMP